MKKSLTPNSEPKLVQHFADDMAQHKRAEGDLQKGGQAESGKHERVTIG